MKLRMSKKELYVRHRVNKVARLRRFIHLLNMPQNDFNLSGDVVIEMDDLSPELKAVVIGYFKDKQDRINVAASA